MTTHAAIAALQGTLLLISPITSYEPGDDEKNPKNPTFTIPEEEEKPTLAEDVPPPRRPLPLPRINPASAGPLGLE